MDHPTYNLRAVVQRTGVKADTLRAWERRYGVPMPARTSGGHRVYSEADVQCILWLVARQQEGMNISRAVNLWQTLVEEGPTPTAESPLPLPDAEMSARQPSAPAVPAGDVIQDLRSRWIQACTVFDEREAEQILAQAFALYSPETVCLDVLQKGLSQIGMDWYRGSITAQQEHFASALAMRRLETLLAAAPDPTRRGRVVIGCPAQENHTFSALLLTVLLRRRGWDVLYLGANLPREEMAETARVTSPDLVVLVAQQLSTAATLAMMAQELSAQGTRIAYGGQIFNLVPDLRHRVTGHYLGTELALAPAEIERLLVRPPVPVPARPVSAQYRQALEHFLEKQAQIDSAVWREMSAHGMPQNHLLAAKHNFGNDLTAALALGDLDYLGTDLNWIAGLLSYRQIDSSLLLHFLSAYHRAVQEYLEEPGQLIVAWLGRLLHNHAVATDVATGSEQRIKDGRERPPGASSGGRTDSGSTFASSD